MRAPRRPIRANRLDERYAVAVGIAAGVAAAFAGCEPTGNAIVDALLTGMAVAGVTWAAASASWWAVAGAAGISAVVAVDPVLTMIGGVAFVGGLWIGVRRRDLGVVRGLVAAVALNVLARSELEGFHGASALIGIGVGAILFAVGVRRRKRSVRRLAWSVVGGVGTLAVLAVIGFGLTATKARALLSDGQRLAEQGIAELGRGEFEAASASFDSAGRAFTRATNELDRPWAVGAQAVPVVAQNAEAITDIADTAGTSAAQLGTALSGIDPETLRLINGRFDIAAIEAIIEPLNVVRDSLTDLDGTVTAADSPWIVDPIETRIDRLTADIDDNTVRLDNAVTAAELAPQMLGAEGPRRYLIIFTTPAEARGLDGFMGNFAEIEAVDGQITVSRFGRTGELNAGGPNPTGRVITGPEDWLNQWGRYVLGPKGTTHAVPWSNVTMSPHFPSTAQVIAELYPQSGGQPLDGVFAMDPYVIAALLEFTGPVQIPATNQQLTSENAVDFLLYDQYEINDTPDRVDLLEQVSQQTIGRLLAGSLPTPPEVANSLGVVASEGRLVGWTRDENEEALFEAIGMSGSLPELEGADGFGLVVNNAAGNKIDTYLDRAIDYRAVYNPDNGELEGTLTITLTNTAPASGLPNVVIGNAIRQPPGTSRLLVSVYTALPVMSVALDNGPMTFESGREHGWNTVRATVTIGSAESIVLTVDLAGHVDSPGGYVLRTFTQSLVLPETHIVDVATPDGTGLVERVSAEQQTLPAEG